MDKPKAEISKGVDGWTSLNIFVPTLGSLRAFIFPPETSNGAVALVTHGIIDALHEALDEVEGDG